MQYPTSALCNLFLLTGYDRNISPFSFLFSISLQKSGRSLVLVAMEDPSSKQGAMSRRDSLAISALLNDVAVDPYRSPDWEQTRHHHRGGSHDYFSSRPNSGLMSSSVPSSPGGPRREKDSLYVPVPSKEHQRPTTSWDPSTSVTPEGYHRRKTSKGNIIVSSIAKAKRKRISQEQFQRLMEVFEQTDTPSSEVRENLAQELGMTKREVQVNNPFLIFNYNP